MKTQPIKITTRASRKLAGILATTIVVPLLFVTTPAQVLAVDAVWLSAPVSGDWNTGTNWSTSPNAPVNPGDTATFNTSSQTLLLFSATTIIESITFNPGISAFTISTDGNALTLQGAGIKNNSGQTQTITNNGQNFSPPEVNFPAGLTRFSNASTAGNVTITNDGGEPGGGGATRFGNVSTAGSATITNNGGAVSAGFGGATGFFDTSNAGIATITNKGRGVSGALGGSTLFFDSSTAANATINNNTGGGATSFFNNATAANATINNNGGGPEDPVGGSTTFSGTSTAGNATIITNGGTGGGSGGSTFFVDSSDGGTARAITNGNGRFDISGLTTAGTRIGSIEGSGNYFLGSKTLTVGGNNLSTTVSGIIQDGRSSGGTGGSLTKVGMGTLTLTGANTYSGGTTISDGALQLGNGGTTGSIAGDVTDNGILAFDRNNALTFGGVISGTGSVQQNGTGTTVLVGDSTFTGGTIINAGVLQLGNGGTTGSIVGNVTDNGILAFDRSNVLTFVGVISGTGSVQQNGTGTTVLVGNSTFTGGTIINAGVLQLGNGGTSGSIVGNVTNNGILVFNRSNVLTFGGAISGTGSVQQNGTGTTVLVGENIYTGATTVNAGSLIVDGSIASAQTLVNGGGLLGGRGTLGGSLVNSGIVSPGDSPGTLTVNRDYTQNASGTLRIEVAGLGVSQHDLLAMGGHASLAGTLQLIRLGDFKLHVGDQLTFLTANGGVSGSFGAVQNEFVSGTIVKAEVITLPNAVVLEGTQGSFVPVACTPNAVAVAHALDSAVGDPGASTLISFLDDQPINQLCGDLQLIAPEQLASIFNIGVSLANVQTANLKRRMEDIRAGSSGFSAAGFTLNGSAPSGSGGFAGVTGPEGKSGPSPMAPTPENRWGVWVTGIGEFTNVDSTDNAAGYDLQTGGVTLGVDYRVCPNFAIGLTAGYAHTNADLANGGDVEVNGGTFGLYTTVFGNGFYLDTAITGGPSGYDTHRTALLGSANGSTDGGDFNVLVAAGYDWKKGGLTIGPTANFQYTYVGFDGFTESGSLAPLQIHSQNAESERTAFGMKASYDWKVGRVVIVPQISLAWQHEYGSQAYSIVSSFASGAGNSFTVNSPKVGRDSLLIGAGAAVLLSERISVYAYYDGEVFRTNYQSNNVSAGVRVTF